MVVNVLLHGMWIAVYVIMSPPGDILRTAAQLRDTIGPSYLENDDVLNACIALLDIVTPEALAYIVKEFPKVIQKKRRAMAE